MKPNRCPLICRFCLKPQDRLPTHLQSMCMKRSTKEQIEDEVNKARESMTKHLWEGRVYEFSELRVIITKDEELANLIQLLESHGCFVRNIPPATMAGQTMPQQAVVLPTAPEEEYDKMDTVEPQDPLSQPETGKRWDGKLRKIMKEHGLYEKHNTDSDLLSGFKKYLRDDLGIPHCKQEVDNVARFLYFMDAQEPGLQFVRDIEKTRSFFTKLSHIGLKKQTVTNFLKNLKRFLRYIIYNTTLSSTDTLLYRDCRAFRSDLRDLQKSISKQVSEEITGKCYTQMSKSSQKPRDCLRVLRAARKDFLEAIAKATLNEELDIYRSLLILYYLQSLLMLKYLQRAAVVKNMKVSEWLKREECVLTTDGDRSRFVVITVNKHKTVSQQVAKFSLNEEEQHWFHVYFTHIRTRFLCSLLMAEDDPNNKFFISTSGNPIYSPSNDVMRLHRKYNVPNVTGHVARHVFEMAPKYGFTNEEKCIIADYLAQTMATSEKDKQFVQPENICRAATLLSKLASVRDSSDSDAESGSSSLHIRGVATSGTCPKMSLLDTLNLFIQQHPVSLEGEIPKGKIRKLITGVHDRKCYKKWRGMQEKMRLNYVLAYFPRRQPSSRQITKYIERQGWKNNKPSVEKITELWKPLEVPESIGDNKHIKKLVKSQKWKGLLITDGGDKGRRVVTTRKFQKGEVVCDYHGTTITAAEGKELMKSVSEEEMGYFFFFRDSQGKKLCMHAQTVPCHCHPDRDTFGRQINHSRKRKNLYPEVHEMDLGEIKEYVILLIALKDLDVNTELLLDYGIGRTSFLGEGRDLVGLDD
ncbi:uncharacterized protein LOC121318606 [Polyodon spathula]|uniref:uncharacterized protein LOC121318606 n=1 Tax=Polyodon spathula TaxID=7913 RepID=UPI001B7DDABD|nr:uncharacterized protein LOC121318606 [Polyodon spathula]